MLSLADIKAYADIRRLVSPTAYTTTMAFLAWHNQQRQTPPLEIWQAVVVAFAVDARVIDRMLFPSVRLFLHERDRLQPTDLEGCRLTAAALLAYLFPDENPD